MTENQLTIDVRMTPAENGGDDTEVGEIKARVSDDGGTPLKTATVEVGAVSGEYREEKQPGGLSGTATFPDLPVQDYVVTISEPNFKTITVEVGADQFGGGDITRGY